MNEKDLNSFQEFEKKHLVIKITGAVQESNLAEFEEKALVVLSSINMDLTTDDQFSEAEQNVKDCKLIEQRIAQARQNAIMQTTDIAAIIKTTEILEGKFRTVRLALEKKVVSEKELRKNEILTAARNHIQGMLISSSVKHGFIIDNAAIMAAAKNKRSLAKIREAIAEVIEDETLRLANMEADFSANMALIQASEVEYPGLYPDKKNLALSSSEVVESQISARVATFRFEIAEKERKEKERIEIFERAKKEPELMIVEETKSFPEPFTTPTPPFTVPPPRFGVSISLELRLLAAEMNRVASRMKSSMHEEIQRHGEELAGAADMAVEWAEELEG